MKDARFAGSRTFKVGDTLTDGEQTGYAVRHITCKGCVFNTAFPVCTAAPALRDAQKICSGVIFVPAETFALKRLKGEV